MKKRIVSSIIGLVPVIAAIVLSGWSTGILVFILAIVGLNELYGAFKEIGIKPASLVGYISCYILVILPFYSGFSGFHFQAVIYFSLLIMVLYAVFKYPKSNIIDLAATFFGMAYIVFLLSFIVLLRIMDNGMWYVWIAFIGAWAADTAAYFAGTFLGKKKLIPQVSPKKTVEGSIGGVLGAAVLTGVYGIIAIGQGVDIKIYHFVILGMVCGLVSQLGDLFASSIKRHCGIKDFGWLIPGHGGVLDRFDSIIFTAPVVYIYITLI